MRATYLVSSFAYLGLATVLILLITDVGVSAKEEKTKCDICTEMIDKFHEMLKKTEKSNFGGGNTKWEERTLGSWKYSETRLIEIAEKMCEDGKKECHSMLEEHEEVLENWWFKEYAKKKETDIFTYMCIDHAKACCPENTYGPKCEVCPGGIKRPCSGHGKCVGNGTREPGKEIGLCDCDTGYSGELCDMCKDGFWEKEKNDSDILCTVCHIACKSTCWEDGPKGCDDCKPGWEPDEDSGCRDVNECRVAEQCEAHQYCLNSAGSYSCLPCDRACDGCTAGGNAACKECALRHWRKEDRCVPCHQSCKTSCTGPESSQCDACDHGWLLVPEVGCTDVDECEERAPACGDNQYCVNTEGSFQCIKCDKTCSGCYGTGPEKCLDCRKGYYMANNTCHDIDECKEGSDPCVRENEHCINTPGAFKCDCDKGYTRKGDHCVKKEVKPARKKKVQRKPKKKAPANETSDDKSSPDASTVPADGATEQEVPKEGNTVVDQPSDVPTTADSAPEDSVDIDKKGSQIKEAATHQEL